MLATPDQLPGFWIFMYRINPFTYILEAFLGTSLANASVHCASNEYLYFSAPGGSTCDEYMDPYMKSAGGFLIDGSGSDCKFCAMDKTNDFLDTLHISFANRWRDFGLVWAYSIFNIAAAVTLYWLVRVPKGKKSRKE
ncbi:hypothetical protein IMZ48_36990 [Candidatus Bathyarchaeota archaeon]|nr:hypothetical protein [Candidatus Bathyarchaeota archaeon]